MLTPIGVVVGLAFLGGPLTQTPGWRQRSAQLDRWHPIATARGRFWTASRDERFVLL